MNKAGSEPETGMGVPFFSGNKLGTLRVFIRTIDDVVKEIKMGIHNHAMFENIGANPVFISPSTNAADTTQWIEAGGWKVLDDFDDESIYLVCGAALTTQIRVSLWKGKQP